MGEGDAKQEKTPRPPPNTAATPAPLRFPEWRLQEGERRLNAAAIRTENQGFRPVRGGVSQGVTSTRPSGREPAPAASSSSWPARLTKGFPQHHTPAPTHLPGHPDPATRATKIRDWQGRADQVGEGFLLRSGARASPYSANHGRRLHAARAAEEEGPHPPRTPPAAGPAPSTHPGPPPWLPEPPPQQTTRRRPPSSAAAAKEIPARSSSS